MQEPANPDAVDNPASPPRFLRALRLATLIVGAIFAALFAVVAVTRLEFPVELEWMGGGVLDAVERVLRHEGLYVAPGAAYVPFIYPPLYFWVCALASRAMPLLAACRVVSLVSTLATAALLFAMARRLRATRFWSAVGVGLYFAAYSFNGYWYDLERADSLTILLILVAVTIVLSADRVTTALVGGLVMGIAFFAKQPALIVMAGGVAGLAATREWRRAAAFGGAGALVVLVGTKVLDTTSGGWFSTYVFTIPSRHGVRPELFTVFLVIDASEAFALFAATAGLAAAVLTPTLRSLHRRTPVENPDLVLFVFVLLGALTASALGRWHVGGWYNVLMYWSVFACAAFAIGATKLEAAAHDRGFGVPVGTLLCGASLLQMGRFGYTPDEASPDAGRVRDARIVAETVSRLEQSGEVILSGRGHVTTPRHFHIAALMDILRGGFDVPADLAEGLRSRRYAAYIVDEFGELSLEVMLDGRRSELYGLVLSNYFVAQRLDDREPRPVIGWIAHPSWVLRPRKTPLTGLDGAALERRLWIEMGIAEERMRAVQAGARQVDDGWDIEDLAARTAAPGAG